MRSSRPRPEHLVSIAPLVEDIDRLGGGKLSSPEPSCRLHRADDRIAAANRVHDSDALLFLHRWLASCVTRVQPYVTFFKHFIFSSFDTLKFDRMSGYLLRTGRQNVAPGASPGYRSQQTLSPEGAK